MKMNYTFYITAVLFFWVIGHLLKFLIRPNTLRVSLQAISTLRAQATFSRYELSHASSYRENVASARRVGYQKLPLQISLVH